MGRRVFKKLIVLLFLVAIHHSGLLAQQIETDTINTLCEFDVYYTITQPTCPGEEDGSINLEVLNNAGAISIDWLEGSSGNNAFIESLAPGTYQVAINDEELCFDTLTFTLTYPLPVTFYTQKDNSCPGLDNGQVLVVPTSGIAEAYSVDEGPLQPEPLLAGLEPGPHNVKAYNIGGCYTEEIVDIIESETPAISFESETTSCIENQDASFIVIIETVSNTETFEYSIDGNTYFQDSTFENVGAGVQEIYIKNNAQCVFTDSIEILIEDEPEILFENNDVSCPGAADASFIVIIETVSNTEDYEYSIDGINYQSDSTFENLGPDLHEVFIKNNAGCVFERSVFLDEPPTPTIDLEVEDVTCPAGADASFIVIIETVSNSDYEYSIDGTNYQADSVFNNLPAGDYTVYAKDQSECVHTELVEIEEPTLPTIDFDVQDVTCPEGNDASFIVIIETVSNTENFEFSIDGTNYQADSVFTNLEAGVYDVYSRNTDGCVFTELMQVDEPDMPVIDFEINNVTCPNGNDASFIVIIETVSNSENFEFSINENEFQEDSTFYNLPAGIHDVTIRNEQNCLFTETIEITDPDIPDTDFNINPVTCSGGNDASFIVIIETVSNSNIYEYSIDGINYQADSIFTDLEGGLYEVFLRNENGCVSSDLIVINEPQNPVLSFDINDVTCTNGTDASLIVIIETVSNNDIYEYSLDGNNFQPDSVFNDLEAGIYTAYIRNQNDCVYSEIFIITEPDETDVNLINEDVTCPNADDGTILITALGPDSIFEYSIDGINFQASNLFEDLGPGTYDVIVRNSSACLFTETTFITAPSMPLYEIDATSVSCNGGTDGNLMITVLSGLEPFEFSLDNGPFQSVSVFQNLSAGEYQLSLKDDTGCVFTSVVNLEEPPPIAGLVSSENETCDYENGWVAIAVEGGTSPYEYNWETEETSPAISELSEGVYYVTIIDSQNCLYKDSVEIINEPAPDLTAELQNLVCYNDQNGFIKLNVDGVAAPFNYFWSTGQQSQSSDQLENLSAGAYSVTITDQNNCYASQEFILTEPDELKLDAELRASDNYGHIDLRVSGGVEPYSYEWSNGKESEDLENILFGIYQVTVTDANNCEATKEFKMFDPKLPVEGSINVYPTLTSSSVNVDIQLPEAQDVNIYLIDELGRLVQVINPNTVENEVITMDMEKLPGATYFIRIEIGGEFIVRKVVKVLE